MNKTTRLLTVLILVCVLLTCVACHEHTFDEKWSSDAEYHWHSASCGHADQQSNKGAHEDVNKDGVCDTCEYVSCSHTFAEEWSSNAESHWHASTCEHAVKGSESAHADANSDGLCDTCNYECGDHTHTYETKWSSDADSHWHAATCIHTNMKQAISSHRDSDGDFICDVCEYVIHVHTAQTEWTSDIDGHWHSTTCEHTDAKVDYAVHVDSDANNKCDVCASSIYEKVTYTFTVEDKTPQKATEDLVYGIFTVGTGAEIRNRTKSFTDITTGEAFSFTKSVKVNGSTAAFYVNAAGEGKLTLIIQNGSSGATTQILKMYKPGSETPVEISYPGTSDGSPMYKLEIDIDTPGIYKFQCGGTTDIYHAVFSAVVEKSNVAGIQVSNMGTVDYLVGSPLDTSALMVEKVYENLRTEVLSASEYTINSQQYNKDNAGEYTITISYSLDGQDYTTEYEVRVYAVEDITVGTNAIREVKQNGSDASASPYNGVYANTAFKQLYMVGETFSTDGLSVTVHGACGSAKKDFIFNDGFEVSGHDTSTAGKQTVTVSHYGKSKELTINVMAKPNHSGDLTCYVDATYQTVGAYSSELGAYQFNTIQQALNFIEALKLPWNASKVIVLAQGTYNEKLEITIPNLTIVGLDYMENNGQDASKTIIEWDSLYGTLDESGYTHTTDSTATLAVRHSAEGFTLVGVTVSNYWNSIDRFNADLGEGYAEHRALAMLVQADKVTIHYSRILGYQDTIEFFTGRSYVGCSYIAGTTDFIFGTDATVLFVDCEIRSIVARDNKGGYITAFKGNNKNSKVDYGAIFYGCRFTCDEGVASYSASDPNAVGLTAIGRPWGADAAVAIINCELGGHISKAASTGASRGERYVSMSGNLAENARYVEYGNTGLGAISESQKGVTILSESEVANYINVEKIFAMVNGQVKYDSQWACVNKVIATDIADADGNKVGTYYGYANTKPTVEDICAVITVPDDMMIEGLYTDSAFTTAYEPTVLSPSYPLYVKFVSSDPTIKTNKTIDLTGITQAYEGTTGTYDVITIDATNGKFALNGSGDWVQMNTGTTLTFAVLEGSKVEFVEYNDAGLITSTIEDGIVTLTATGNTYIKSITVIVPYVETTTIDLSQISTAYEGTTGYYDGIYVDATNGKFANNGSGWMQINTGTVLTFSIAEGSTVTFVEYTTGSINLEINGTVATLTAVANDYIKSITITVPSSAVTYTFAVPAKGNSYSELTLINDIFYMTDSTKTENVKITGAAYEADGLTFTESQVSLTSGKVQIADGVAKNGISFTVEEGKTTSLKVIDSAGDTVEVGALKINGVTASAFDTLPTESVSKYEFTLSAGTYYLGGAGGGAYIYGLIVTIE